MDVVAGIAVYVMPCHDCGIYSKHLWTLYHDACETICLHSIVMLYLYIMYLYGLWPEIKSYYYYYCNLYVGVQHSDGKSASLDTRIIVSNIETRGY